MATAESRGRQRMRPDLPVPPRPRSQHDAVRAEQARAQATGAGTPPRRPRSRHRGAVRSEPARAHSVDSPPPPRPGPWHAQGQGTDSPLLLPRPGARHAPAVQPYGSTLAAFLYLCAALGGAVLIWVCKIPPPLSYGSLQVQGCRGLAAAVIAAMFRRHPPGFVDQELPGTPNQILAAPAPPPQIQQPNQPRLVLTGSILDADQVAAAIRSSMADITRPFLAVSPPQANSDGGGSSSNSSERINDWYTPIDLLLLEAGDAQLIVPGFFQQLQEMIRGLPEADAAEMLRGAFRDANKSDAFYRLSDVLESQCVAHGLTDRSTETLVMMTKITAKLLHLIWSELKGQNQQLCEGVKMECFREIAGQSIEKLLDVALSLSNVRWSADDDLTIFDALVDVLYNMSDLPLSTTEFIPHEIADLLDLPLNRYDPVHNVAAHIFWKMVVDFRGTLEAATRGTCTSIETTIHPATVILVQFLEFFYRNGTMMKSVLGTAYCMIELTMINAWVSTLGRDAETMVPAEIFQVKGRRHIFVLNNLYYVYQMEYHGGGFLSDMELASLSSLIHQYIESYLNEYWVPLVGYLDGDSLNMPRRSSLDNFLEEFFSISYSQMIWKVQPELRKRLHEAIAELIVPKYEAFLGAPQEENPGSRWPCWSNGMWRARREEPVSTAARLVEVIGEIFEG